MTAKLRNKTVVLAELFAKDGHFLLQVNCLRLFSMENSFRGQLIIAPIRYFPIPSEGQLMLFFLDEDRGANLKRTEKAQFGQAGYFSGLLSGMRGEGESFELMHPVVFENS